VAVVELHQQVSGSHPLVLAHRHRGDVAADLRDHRHDVALDLRVVGGDARAPHDHLANREPEHQHTGDAGDDPHDTWPPRLAGGRRHHLGARRAFGDHGSRASLTCCTHVYLMVSATPVARASWMRAVAVAARAPIWASRERTSADCASITSMLPATP